MVRSVVLAAVTVAVTLAVAEGRPRAGSFYSPFFGTIPCTYDVQATQGDASTEAAVDPNSVTAIHLRVPPSPVLAPVVVPPTFRPGVFAPSPFLAIRHDAQVPAFAAVAVPQQETQETGPPSTGAQGVVAAHPIVFPNTMLLSSVRIPAPAPAEDDDDDSVAVRMPQLQQVFMFMPAAAPQVVFGERHDVQAAPFGLRKPVQEAPAFMRDPAAPAPAVATPVDPVETLFGDVSPPDTLYGAPPPDAPAAEDSGAALGMSLPDLDEQGRPLVQLSTFPTELPDPFFDASSLKREEGEEVPAGGAFQGVVPAGIAQALQPTFEIVPFENSKAHPSLLGKRPSEDADAVVIA